jgi:hypothetical protein
LTIRRKAIRFLLFILSPSVVFAQGKLTDSPVTGDIRPITLQPGAAETNVVFASLAAGAAADDNNNNTTTHPIGGAQYFADPSVAIQETRSHLAWDLSYHPTVRFYVPSAFRDRFNQVAGGTLHYDVNKRLGIGLRQDYFRTSDPFQQFGETPLHPGVGLGNQPGLTPFGNFTRTQFLSQAEIDYRLAKHTSVGVSGDFKQTHGDELGGQHRALIDSHITLGSAFLSQQISVRQAVGVQYEFLDVIFPGRDTRTRTYGGLLFDQITITPHTSFSVFGGAEYSQIHNQLFLNILGVVVPIPVSSTMWSPSAGATFDWRRDRLGLQARFVRRVSDGGGLLSAVDMYDSVVRFRGKIARHWEVNAGGEFTSYTLLNESKFEKRFLLLSGGISRELSRNLWIRALYERAHDIGGDQSTLLPFANHNRVTLAVERNFNLPLGR